MTPAERANLEYTYDKLMSLYNSGDIGEGELDQLYQIDDMLRSSWDAEAAQSEREAQPTIQSREPTVSEDVGDWWSDKLYRVSGDTPWPMSERESQSMGRKIAGLLDITPMIGGGMSAAQAKRDVGAGNYGDAAMNAMFGVLDVVPAMAATRSAARTARGAAPGGRAAKETVESGVNAVRSVAANPPARVAEFLAGESGAMPVPFASRPDLAVAQAEEVLGLLRSGRENEITDQMLDMGDPVLNARMNEHLYRNYDLPMDAASRMGRAEAMDARPEYHGTTTGSEMRYPRSDYGSGSRKGIGFVTSSDPYVSSSYADPSYGSVFPMMNRVPSSGYPTIDAGGEIWSQIPGDAMVSYAGREVPVSSYASGPADMGGVFDTNQVSRGAAIEGDPGVQFNNLLDRSIHAPRPKTDDGMEIMREFQRRSSEPSTVTMRHDTRGMRSRFARFDPRLAHLRNLSASLAAAGVPLGLLSMQPEGEQY